MRFISEKTIDDLKARQIEIRGSMTVDQLKVVDQVDKEFEKVSSALSDFEAEARITAAGLTQQDAEDLATFIKERKIKMSEVFMFTNGNGDTKTYVVTPYYTVVNPTLYIDALEDAAISLSKKNQDFTSLSFFGLIKLAFTNLTKGKRNG